LINYFKAATIFIFEVKMLNQQQHSLLFVLEGNIGAGKSTLLKIINSNLNLKTIPEPTSKWQKLNDGDNLLNLFYTDIKRWAYTFQSYAFVSRVNEIIKCQQENYEQLPLVSERSIFCDRFCFAKNCFELGFMKNIEWQIYTEQFDWLAENYAPRPSGFIYLKTDPKICLQRIKKRNRPEEKSITLSYLESLHQKHEDWLIYKKNISDFVKQIPILELDCNYDLEVIPTIQVNNLEKIKNFIEIIKISNNIKLQTQNNITSQRAL